MKTNIRLILVIAIIILSVTALIAQTKDIVYLKNGSVIKGTILEMVPDKTIKVQTADGNIFVYNMSEVEKISKEAAAPAPSNEPKPFIEQRGNENQRGYEGQSSSEGSGAKFSIYGGISLPMGNFAKKEGSIYENGYAKLGWSAGIQFVTGGTIGWIIDGNYSQNKFDLPTSATTIPGKYEWVGWSSILALTGIKIGTDNSTGTNFFIAPLVGALFGKSPSLDFTPPGSSTSENITPSASGTGFAYGATVEAIFGGHVTLSAKYIASKPKFKYSVDGQDYDNDQKIALLLVSIGVGF
jgi:hypothetical protein